MAQNRTSFEKSRNKGESGEAMLDDLLMSEQWIVYRPINKDRPHYFDRLATLNKQKVIAIEVKTKARMNFPMRFSHHSEPQPCTGFNRSQWGEYQRFVNDTKVPLFVFFIDDKIGDIHCVNLLLLTLDHSRDISGGKILVWPLKDMTYWCSLNREQVATLSKLDQRNYDFMPAERMQKSAGDDNQQGVFNFMRSVRQPDSNEAHP